MIKKCKRLLCGLLAGICTAAAMPAFSAGAEVIRTSLGQRGDLTQDGYIDIGDVIFLEQSLIYNGMQLELMMVNSPDGEQRSMAFYADLNADGCVNALDLTLIKRAALGLYEPDIIYEESADEDFIEAPISQFSPSLRCQGTNTLLMLVVEFPDCKFTKSYTTEEIYQTSFGPGDPNDPAYPLESVIGYYERASYGALTMNADIYRYNARYNSTDYVYIDNGGNYWADATRLLDELMSDMDDEIDFTRYDVNRDGIMDTILLSVADTASDDGWWPCSGQYQGSKRFDGIRPGNIILGNTAPSDKIEYNSTWIHELGHGMGLPDYYKYKNAEDDWEGLHGQAGWEMMDDARFDMCAFSKLMYGWYKPSQIHVYTGGTQVYKLKSSQVEGNCIIIPRYDLNGYFSEYMVVEYATIEGNNPNWWGSFGNGGIRVLHAEASSFGQMFKYENYSKLYDESNNRQRVLRLANDAEGGGFFRTYDEIDGSISGFHWYDSSGYQTVDTGIKITVGELVGGRYTVIISEK